MVAAVHVVREWRHLDRDPGFANLDDDACSFLAARRSGMLASAIRGVGTDAIFNGTQIDQLLAELRQAAAEAPSKEIVKNIADVVQFIEARLPRRESSGDYYRYVVCLSD
jgi:hypothetical protein